jgi:hypothetical protein
VAGDDLCAAKAPAAHRDVLAEAFYGRSGSSEKSLIDAGEGKSQRAQNAKESHPLTSDSQSAPPARR